MGCTYSSPRDKPTVRRSVPDVSLWQSALTCLGKRPLPGQAPRACVKKVPMGLTGRLGRSPGGLTGAMGPPVPWVLVCRLYFRPPKEGICTGNQEGPSRRLPPSPPGKSWLRVHGPVWSCPAGSGWLRALRYEDGREQSR